MTDGIPSTWRIGVNVPWVAAWSAESKFRLRPSRTFPGSMELEQRVQPGVGTPMLSGMNMERQRLGIMEHRCHVCGEPTPEADRYLFPAVTGTFVQFKGRVRRYASHMPPTHQVCAEHAMTACPHLRSRYASPIRYPRDHGEIRPETSLPSGLEFLGGQLPSRGSVVFGFYRVFDEEFSRAVQLLRAGTAEST